LFEVQLEFPILNNLKFWSENFTSVP